MSRIDMRKTDLRHKFAMDTKMFEGAFDQISNQGRQILKQLESFRFTMKQSEKILQNNSQLVQNIESKRKTIEELSNKLYQVLFDIENIDLEEAFREQNMDVKRDVPNNSPAGEKPEQQIPPIPPNMQNNIPGAPQSNTPSGEGGGGAKPPNGSSSKSEENESEENQEDEENIEDEQEEE